MEFQNIINCGSELGLQLNHAKCEIFFSSTTNRPNSILTAFETLAPGIKIKSLNSWFPNFFLESVEDIATKKLNILRHLDRLHPQIAYFIIKNCLLIPKFTYFLRTSPLFLFPTFLEQADSLLKDSLQAILNIHLENHNWIQATLPIKLGGLGIRTIYVTDICLPSYISSAYGASSIHYTLFKLQWCCQN